MLWGIDPLLDADLLYALRRMGHGDEIAVVDTNYPAASNAMSTVVGRPLPMAGVSAARAVEAVSEHVDSERRAPAWCSGVADLRSWARRCRRRDTAYVVGV